MDHVALEIGLSSRYMEKIKLQMWISEIKGLKFFLSVTLNLNERNRINIILF